MTDRFTGSMDPARNGYTIVPGPEALNPPVKALWANVAGTVTVEGADGSSIELVVSAPGPVDFAPVKVTAWTGAAGTLKGLWG